MSAPAPCPLCGNASARRMVRGGYAIHRCAPCDFEFVHPVPNESALRAVYERGYFTGGGSAGYQDYFGAERAGTDEKARVRLDALATLGLRTGDALLDVGCADGRFVVAATARGLRARGVENSPEARAALARDVRERIDESLAAAARHGPFDAITLWDVLEHLPDPLGALREIRTLLAPDGLLAVVLPVIDNVNARRWPASWDQYKPPEHLWFFSRRALRETLEREVGGRTVHEAPAWRREARVLDVALGVRGLLARAEGAFWRAAERAGSLADGALVDSWMVVMRRGG